jgi:uncharacterized protein with PQ loop repeat
MSHQIFKLLEMFLTSFMDFVQSLKSATSRSVRKDRIKMFYSTTTTCTLFLLEEELPFKLVLIGKNAESNN